MGFLDTVKTPQSGGTQPTQKGSFLNSVKVPQDTSRAFGYQGVAQQYANQNRVQTQAAAEASKFAPVKSFKQGYAEHKGEQAVWNYSDLSREFVKEGGQMVTDSIIDLGNRLSAAMDTPNESLSDYIADSGSYIMGVINVGFSPVAGALKGAENVPVLGHVATFLNKVASGLAYSGSNTAVVGLDMLPLEEDTKAKLEPLFSEVGGLAGMLVGFKAAGKVGSKVSQSRFVKPKIAAFETKLKEIGEIIKNDPKLSTEVARFVAERGPVRSLPVTSETPGTTRIPATPNQKHGAYAEKMGYEPYIPPSQLPVIDAGMGGSMRRTDPNLPTVQIGEPKTTFDTSTSPTQGALSLTPAESGTLRSTGSSPTTPPSATPRSATPETSARPVGEAPVAKQATVSVNNQTYALADKVAVAYQKRLDAHNKRMTDLQEQYQKAQANKKPAFLEKIELENSKWEAYLTDLVKNIEPVKFETSKPAVKDERDITVEPIKPARDGSPEYNRILMELDLAEPGYRYSLEHDATRSGPSTFGVPSTFPEWMPDGTRRSSVISRYLKGRDGTVNDLNIKYKEGSVLDRLDKAVKEQEARYQRANEPPIQEATITVDGKKRAVTEEDVAQEYAGTEGALGGEALMPKPVESTGKARTPALTGRAVADFAKETKDTYSELPEYRQMNIEADAANALRLVETDPVTARTLAMGQARRPDVTNSSVWRALYEKAQRTNDVQTIVDLARSPVAEALTRFGQEAVALRGIGRTNAAKTISDIENWRKEEFTKRRRGDPKEATAKEMAVIERELVEVVRKDPQARQKIIDVLKALECK